MTLTPLTTERRLTVPVLGSPIDVLTAQQALERISQWVARRESRYVCICNVHSVVTASGDPTFMDVLANADMATPDGAPVAWLMRALGAPGQQRVCGPDLMLNYLHGAAKREEPIFLLGSTDATLDKLKVNLLTQWPTLCIAGAISPPFRELSAEEDEQIVQQINASGAGTVWISLGCPKQERWMQRHKGRINAVMIGVGAAFDFHAGTVKRAPRWMRESGLEWLHRLASEPRRLIGRYAKTNSVFLIKSLRVLLKR